MLDTFDDSDPEIKEKIERLQDSPAHTRSEILIDLENVANERGLSNTHILQLFDLVFDVKEKWLHAHEKKLIFRKILIPNGRMTFQGDLIYRILSAIGYSRVYYQNGRKIKEKKLSPTLQNLLLEWLICYIHLFDERVFLNLVNLLPMLLHLLLFEYSRPLIANLIFLTVLNCNRLNQQFSLPSRSLKNWQIKFVVDLYLKFPTDDSLKGLLFVFHNAVPGLDYSKFLDNSDITLNISDLNINPKFFNYPNFEYHHKLKAINPNYTGSYILETCLSQYKTFNKTLGRNKYKRLKTGNKNEIFNVETDLDVIDFHSNMLYPNLSSKRNSLSIYDINSFTQLIDDISQVRLLNIPSIFNDFGGYYNNCFKYACLIFNCELEDRKSYSQIESSQIDDFVKDKLAHGSRLELEMIFDKLSDLLSLRPEYMDELSCLKCLMNHELESISTELSLAQLIPLKLKILKFSSMDYSLDKLLSLDIRKHSPSSFYKVFLECNSLFCNLYTRYGDAAVAYIDRSIKAIYQNYSDSFEEFSVLEKLAFLLMLNQTIKRSASVPDTRLHLLSPDCVLPPMPIIHSLLFTINPIVVSELCKYLAATKKYPFPTEYKSIHNSIIMDTLNFIWRDRGFYYEENTVNRGFYLPSSLINKLPTLNVFGDTNLTQLNLVGNLFHNPAWSHIVTHIIWDLEDQDTNITKRHPGPITEESVEALKNNSDHVWLNANYEQLKLQVLRRLDALGYEGLGDLLFNSLRSLTHSREPRITEQGS